MLKKLILLLLGWVLSAWLPVPYAIRSAAAVTVSAARNAVHAVVDTMKLNVHGHA